MRHLSTTLIALLALFVTTGNEKGSRRSESSPRQARLVVTTPQTPSQAAGNPQTQVQPEQPPQPQQTFQQQGPSQSQPQAPVQIRELTEQEKQDLERKIEEAKRNDPEFRRLMNQFPNLGGIRVGSSDSLLNFGGGLFNAEETGDNPEIVDETDTSGAKNIPPQRILQPAALQPADVEPANPENFAKETVETGTIETENVDGDPVRATHFDSFLRQELARVDRRLWNAFHNLSHRRTHGYKVFRFDFPEPLPRFDGDSERITFPRMNGPVPIEVDMSQGAIVETGRPLDIAIEGDGFLGVNNSRTGETMYTRSGRLTIDPNGNLAIATPYQSQNTEYYSETLEPGIVVPEGSLGMKITGRGNVWIKDAKGNDLHAGILRIVGFAKPERLRPLDERFFEETPDSGIPVAFDNNGKGFPVIRQGCLECSNVHVEVVLEEIDRLREQRHGLQQLLP